MPELVVFERGDLVTGKVPDSHGVLAKGQKELILIQEDEGGRRLEALLRDADHVAGAHVDNLQVLVLLLDEELLVELLDEVYFFVAVEEVGRTF